VHDFLTVGAAHPLQEAGAMALRSGKGYYHELRRQYTERRDLLLKILREVGFQCFIPQGAYYIMTSIESFEFPHDVAFAEYLVREVGVATVPGSSFYHNSSDGNRQVRFCFCKKDETLLEAGRRLRTLQKRK
jgi:aminotransferase